MKTSYRLIVFQLLLCFVILNNYGETIIQDSTEISGIWSKSNSPYHIEGVAIIPEGTTLEIEPGVVIEMKTGNDFNINSENFDASCLIVKGKLLCPGNDNDSIVFTRKGNDGYWGSIIFLNQPDTVIIDKCIFEYGSNIENVIPDGAFYNSLGALTFYRSTTRIQNSKFRNNSNRGLYIVRESNCVIIQNEFCHNNIGLDIYLGSFGKDLTTKNIFHHNDIGLNISSTGEIYQNVFYGNTESGIFTKYQTTINNNTIFDNGKGISGTPLWGNLVINNQVYRNNIGIELYKGGFTYIINNLIRSNNDAVILRDLGSVNLDGNKIINNTIVNNHNSGFNQYRCFGTVLMNNIHFNNNVEFNTDNSFNIKNCIIGDSILIGGINDLGENLFGIGPGFTDTLNGDFSLLANSPAIDGGFIDTSGLKLPDTDLAGIVRLSNGQIDIGAYEFVQNKEYLRLVHPYNEPNIVSNLFTIIKWVNSKPEDGVDVLLSVNKGETWDLLKSDYQGNTYNWLVPETINDSCILLIRNSMDHSIADTSKYVFNISPNTIPGDIFVYGTWKKEFSPYKILGPVIVPADSSLIIEPGVTVLFNKETAPANNILKKGGAIDAQGKIIATGQPDNQIIFSTLLQNTYWGNISVNSLYYGDTSMFRYCIFEYGGHGRDGMLDAGVGNIVEFNTFSNSWGNGLSMGRISKNIPMHHNLFLDNQAAGVYVNTYTTIDFALLSNCVFYHNGIGIKNGDKVQVNNSIFSDNTKDYEDYFGYEAIFASCIFDKPHSVTDFDSVYHCLFSTDPKFVNKENLDFHLRMNSPGIDAGNPDDEYSQEPVPNGGRINSGIYGNTGEATKSPAFTLNHYDFSAMGYDTLTLYKNELGSAQGSGKLQIDGVDTEILLWSDDSIVFIAPTANPGSYDVTLTDSDENIFTLPGFIDCHAPEISSVTPFYGLTTGGNEIEIRGQFLGKKMQHFIIDDEILSTGYWSDSLIIVSTLPHAEGRVNIILRTDDLIFADTTFGAYQFFSEAPENLCDELPVILEQGKNYILTCSLVIGESDSLIIEPGVTIIANQLLGDEFPAIEVDGKMFSLGSETEPVSFTSVPPEPGGWKGLTLNNEAILDYTNIEYAITGVTSKSSQTEIRNSTISNCLENGVSWIGDETVASGNISNCRIMNNINWGITCEASCYDKGGGASPEIRDNIIENNEAGGIKMSAWGSTPFSGVSKTTSSSSPDIIGNKIRKNLGFAIQAYASGDYADAVPFDMYRYAKVLPLIKANIITGNNGVFSTNQGYDNSTIELDMVNNTIVNNGGQLFSYGGGTVNLNNSILWELNATEPEINKILKAEYSTSNLGINGEGNLSSDPLFIDISSGNFALQDASPCIDAGHPDLDNDGITWQTDPDDQDADGSRMDMGAIPNLKFPDIPQLISPINSASDLDFPLVLTWNTPKSTLSYMLEVSLNNEFSSLVLSESNLFDTSYVMTNLQEYTTYYWKVKAVNNLGESDWSPVFNFRTAQLPPAAPELLIPANMMANTDTSLYLQWKKIDNAESYHVQLTDHADFSNLIYQNELVGDTVVYVSNLAHLTSYYWRVQAVNSAGTSNWSDTFRFTTIIAPPEVPVLFSPANQAVDREVELAFVWNASNHAGNYTFQVAEDDLFTQNLMSYENLKDTLVFKSDLNNRTKYFWRVKALNINGESEWSEIFDFTTKAPAVGIPELLSPDSAATIEAMRIDLAWSAVKLATHYTLQISDNESFIEPITDDEAISDTSFVFSGFEFGKDYYWRVRAWNETGSGSWSGVFVFTPQKGTPVMPVLLSPLNQQENLDTTLNLNWGKAIFADYYHVQVATTADFASLSIENLQHEDTSVMIQNLPYNTVYFWRVKGINDLSEGEWSAVYSFTTLDPYPEIPIIASPSDGEQINSTTALLVWEDDNTNVTYELQLDNNEDFNSLLIWNTGMGLPNIEIGDLEPNTAYFWRVRCQNSYGYSGWTEVYSFTTGENVSIEHPLDLSFSIYPNPVNEELFIHINHGNNDKLIVEITDVSGRKVWNDEIRNIPVSRTIHLEFKDLKAGVYLITVSGSDGAMFRETFIKE